MTTITMTHKMILDEMNTITDDKNAIEYACLRMNFDGLSKDLNELQKYVTKKAKEISKKHLDNPVELAKEMAELEYSVNQKVLEWKDGYYKEAFPAASHIDQDVQEWYMENAEDNWSDFNKKLDEIKLSKMN